MAQPPCLLELLVSEMFAALGISARANDFFLHATPHRVKKGDSRCVGIAPDRPENATRQQRETQSYAGLPACASGIFAASTRSAT